MLGSALQERRDPCRRSPEGQENERAAMSPAVWGAEVQISRIKLKENKQIKNHCFGFSQEPRTVNRGGWKANIFYPGGISFAWAKEERNEYKVKSKDESRIWRAQTAMIGS